MPYLLDDASVRESPDGSSPLLSALVVLKDTGRPSSGFFKLARRAPYAWSGDDALLWTRELQDLVAPLRSELTAAGSAPWSRP
ncbi:hypothetical protein [Streptomyces sp. NBC_01320]|uniref:hypothetical protein n=1 Tax=Streptomyces sp. NBC_01320 TaxID=2903824 RepID=UPI002E12F723|nr:hypothetical protein OG395_39410 [Streptomyces sp. NBC_01320]